MARELEHRQHRYPLIAPVRAGHCSATLTGAPLRTLAVLERALRAGIIEIPHLSPWWLGGVGGGGAQGTPWAENPRREYSEPLVAVPAGQSSWLRILGVLPLAGPHGPYCRLEAPVGRLDTSSVRRLAYYYVGE